MQALTHVDQLIITKLLESGGVTTTTVIRFSDLLPAAYPYVYERVHRLERLGCLCVQRSTLPGRQGRVLRLCCRCLVAAVGLDTIDASCAHPRPLTPAET